MNLDKRQKVLVGAFAAVLMFWQGSGVLWSIFFGPFDERYTQIQSLDEQIQKKLDAKFQLEMTERRTRQWERRSLPPNPVVASTLYHHWVLDLAEKHKLEKLTVTPKKISTGTSNPVFTKIPISVTAECKIEQLCQFLFDFYRTDLLHKVTHLGIEGLDARPNPTLKVSLELEGLSLPKSKARNTLFADKQATAVSDAMSKKKFDDYQSLITTNRFVRGYNGPPKPPTPPPLPTPAPAPFDSAPFVKFIAAVGIEGQPLEAWLYDQTSNQRTVLQASQTFEISGVKGEVLEIAPRFLRLRVKDKEWRLELGDSLKQMTELKPDSVPGGTPGPAPASTTPAATPTPVTPTTPAAELPKKPAT